MPSEDVEQHCHDADTNQQSSSTPILHRRSFVKTCIAGLATGGLLGGGIALHSKMRGGKNVKEPEKQIMAFTEMPHETNLLSGQPFFVEDISSADESVRQHTVSFSREQDKSIHLHIGNNKATFRCTNLHPFTFQPLDQQLETITRCIDEEQGRDGLLATCFPMEAYIPQRAFLRVIKYLTAAGQSPRVVTPVRYELTFDEHASFADTCPYLFLQKEGYYTIAFEHVSPRHGPLV